MLFHVVHLQLVFTSLFWGEGGGPHLSPRPSSPSLLREAFPDCWGQELTAASLLSCPWAGLCWARGCIFFFFACLLYRQRILWTRREQGGEQGSDCPVTMKQWCWWSLLIFTAKNYARGGKQFLWIITNWLEMLPSSPLAALPFAVSLTPTSCLCLPVRAITLSERILIFITLGYRKVQLFLDFRWGYVLINPLYAEHIENAFNTSKLPSIVA